MTGKEKMFAVMSGTVANQFPVVIPYLGIFLRDHWEEVTDVPWWAVYTGDIEANLQVAKDLQKCLGIDWVPAERSFPREWREKHEVSVRGRRAFILNRETGQEREIFREPPGGVQVPRSETRIHSIADIDQLVEIHAAQHIVDDGSLDYAREVVRELGNENFVFASISDPFWRLNEYLGVYGMMTGLIEHPELVERLLERITLASLEVLKAYRQVGLDGVWVEASYSSRDMISLQHFQRFVAPYLRRLIQRINELGMKSICWFCGDVSDRLEELVQMNSTCISLEESKKNFVIEIADIDRAVAGRACLFGNVDAIGVLQNGSRGAIATEIERQLEIGRRSGRFVMSLGSPVTPSTPTAKVSELVELTREATAR